MNRRHCADYTKISATLNAREKKKKDENKNLRLKQLAYIAPFVGFLLPLYLFAFLDIIKNNPL